MFYGYSFTGSSIVSPFCKVTVVFERRLSLSLRRNLVGCQLEKQKVIPL